MSRLSEAVNDLADAAKYVHTVREREYSTDDEESAALAELLDAADGVIGAWEN